MRGVTKGRFSFANLLFYLCIKDYLLSAKFHNFFDTSTHKDWQPPYIYFKKNFELQKNASKKKWPEWSIYLGTFKKSLHKCWKLSHRTEKTSFFISFSENSENCAFLGTVTSIFTFLHLQNMRLSIPTLPLILSFMKFYNLII